MEKNQYKECFVGQIRHGERADLQEEQVIIYEIPEDPPLTSKGIKQAQETGDFLKQHLQEYERIIIECSPFIRSMMTASQIAKKLGIAKIKINYLAHEWLHHSLYLENPIQKLFIKVKSKEHIIKDFLEGIDFEDSSVEDEDYLAAIKLEHESNSDIEQRNKKILTRMRSMYEKSEIKTAHIIVSHQCHVDAFAQLHGGKCIGANFCAITSYKIQEQDLKLVHDGYDEHVKTY